MGRRSVRQLVFLFPLLAVGVAYWGTTWGWDSDNLLRSELASYVVVAYALYAGSQLPTYITGIREWFDKGRLRPLGQDGLGLIMWGTDVILVSVVLIQLFASSALWLGNMSNFYVGFGMVIVGVLWHLGKTSE